MAEERYGGVDFPTTNSRFDFDFDFVRRSCL